MLSIKTYIAVVYPSRGDEHVSPDSDAAGVLSADLLAFADAVGSCQSVLDACLARGFGGAGASGSGDGSGAPCTLEVEDGGQRLRLRLDGTQYQLVGGKLVACISGAAWPGQAPMDMADPPQAVGREQQLDQLRRLIAAQAERLLHLAYKLNLRGLQQGLHLFLQANALPDGLFGSTDLLETAVFTPRVLQAVDPRKLRAAYMDAVLGTPFTSFDGHTAAADSAALVDAAVVSSSQDTIWVDGKTAHTWLGLPAHSRVALNILPSFNRASLFTPDCPGAPLTAVPARVVIGPSVYRP
jgi:hypothetical protein